MFSPYFRYVRIHSNWTFASLFAGFVTFALVTLLHVVDQVEDPFDHQFGGASVSNMYYKQSRSDDVKVSHLLTIHKHRWIRQCVVQVHTVFAEARATLGNSLVIQHKSMALHHFSLLLIFHAHGSMFI